MTMIITMVLKFDHHSGVEILCTVLSKSLGSTFRWISWLSGLFGAFRRSFAWNESSAIFRRIFGTPIVLIRMNFRTIFRCARNIAAKMRLSRKLVANFWANFRSVLQAFSRKVQTPWSKYESFCCAGVKHSRNLFADFSLQSTRPTVLSNSPGYSPWKAKLYTQNPKALHFLLLLAWYLSITPCTVYTNTRSFPLSPCKYRVELRRVPYLFIKLANISVLCKKGIESVMFFFGGLFNDFKTKRDKCE